MTNRQSMLYKTSGGDRYERIFGRSFGRCDGAGPFRDRCSSFASFACAGGVPPPGGGADHSAFGNLVDRKSNALSDRRSQKERKHESLTEHSWNG